MLKRKKIHILAAIIPLLAALIITWFSGVGIAYAAEPVYSGALQDLQKDPAFDASAYPDNINAKREELIQVIQIAESADGELLIYTYQPATRVKQIKASSINIAHETDNSTGLGFVNYSLTYISSDGVFYKYKVNDFKIRPEALRYYNISQIMRPYDKGIDGKIEHGNTASEMPVEVAQLWTAVTVNGKVSYTKKETDVVEITKEYVGFVTYQDGISVSLDKWYQYVLPFLNPALGSATIKSTFTHKQFVAFSLDRDIDDLIDIEIQFSLQNYNYEICANPAHSHYKQLVNKQKGEVIQQAPVTISGNDMGENVQHGILGHHYTWNRIQRTSDFLKDENNGNYTMTTEGVTDVLGTDWVVNFYDVITTGQGTCSLIDNHIKNSTEIVSDVIILRLKFEKDGTTYNLGVVDNKQTGDGKPDNVYTGEEDKKKARETGAIILVVAIVVAGVVGIVLVCVFCPQVLPVIGRVLAAPFKAINSAIEHRRSKPKARNSKSKPKARNSKSKPRKTSRGKK